MILLSLALACTAKKTPSSDGKQAYFGTTPVEQLALPEFSARNADGTTRGKEDLIGHPTVLWFYPRSGTPG